MSLRGEQRPHNPRRAVAFGCAGALLFTLQDASFKWLSQGYPIIQIIFLRCFLALGLSVVWLRLRGGLPALRVRRPRLFICATCANIIAWYCFYTGLAQLPLTIAICIFFLTPVFISLVAVPLLGEPLGWRQAFALAAGFGGVLVITNPFAAGGDVAPAAVAWILVSVLMWGAMALITRALESSVTIGATLFYNNLAFLLVSACFQAAVWTPPAPGDLAFMILLGGLGVAAQACVFAAYRSANTAVAATTEYTALVWAAIIGWLVWGEVFTAASAFGAALIVGAGLLLLQRRARR